MNLKIHYLAGIMSLFNYVDPQIHERVYLHKSYIDDSGIRRVIQFPFPSHDTVNAHGSCLKQVLTFPPSNSNCAWD